MSDKIATARRFNHDGEEAADFSVSLLPDSQIDQIVKSPGDNPCMKEGGELIVDFTLAGRRYSTLNGGPNFKPNESVSFMMVTEDQAETDRLWHAIVGNGGQQSACGWCKDKWGFSWRFTPRILLELLTDPDPARSKRGFEAMMTMAKIDIAAIQAAAQGMPN